MTAMEMWEAFSESKKLNASYNAWAFGADADELADLVLAGIKTATASAQLLYERYEEPLPQSGEYSVILNSRQEAVCIIRTENVWIVPFEKVDAVQAWKEGEGDRSLSYWRKVHERFFREELESIGHSFNETINVVCEEFIRVYP